MTGGRYAYGVEFLDVRNVNHFWGISFPAFPLLPNAATSRAVVFR
jgi:hypothetical protein